MILKKALCTIFNLIVELVLSYPRMTLEKTLCTTFGETSFKPTSFLTL